MRRTSEGSQFHCFGAQQEKQRSPKVFVLTWWILSTCVSALEQSCPEGVCTVRSEKWAGHESEKKLWQIVDSL